MKKMIGAMAVVPMIAFISASAEGSSHVRQLLKGLFDGAILMTPEKCETFGEGWTSYEPVSGRFPLAVGQETDREGETKKFALGDEGGTYRHRLTIAEMPEHTHRYQDRVGRGIRADYGDDEPTEHRDDRRETEKSGDGNAHNNMPPYLALNFCYYLPEIPDAVHGNATGMQSSLSAGTASAQASTVCSTPRNQQMQAHGTETCRMSDGTVVTTTWVDGKKTGPQTWICQSSGTKIELGWNNDDALGHPGTSPCP